MRKQISFFACGLLGIALLLFGWNALQKRAALTPYLTVFGPVNMKDGIGRQSADLISALKDEVKVSFIATNPVHLDDVPSEIIPFLKSSTKTKGKVAILEDIVWMPEHSPYKKFARHTSKKQVRIAYSMFESTKIPYEWVFIFNDFFDAVVVPDKFLVDVYKNCGVKIPVFELALGLHLEPFFREPLREKAHDPMVFGNLGVCVDRKNQLMLVRAFAKAFGDDPSVRLRINCRLGDHPLIEEIQEEIRLQGLHNVEFTQLALDSSEYLKLFKSLDCLVSLSKGEGYSIQPREAMALGIPVIVTDNTAQTTICESGFTRSVRSLEMEPAFYFPEKLHFGERYNCTLEDAAQALRDIYENYDQYLENTKPAREWVKQYAYANLNKLYLSLVKPKKVILGDRDILTEEYLMTTSEPLFLKYQGKR